MSEPMKFEADVKIRPTGDGVWSVLINGVEMADHILADSVTITLPNDEFELGTARVQLTLVADLGIEAPATIVVVEPEHELSADCWCGPIADKVDPA